MPSKTLSQMFAGVFITATLLTGCQKNDIQPTSLKNESSSLSQKQNTGDAVIFFGLTSDNKLGKYQFNKKLNEVSIVSITGLPTGEKIRAIDFRPATGELYGIGSNSMIYVINTVTGTTRPIGAGPISTTVGGTAVGFDFNPTVDRIRLVTNTGQNLRINPETGTVAFTDQPLKPGTPAVNAVAYTNNFAGSTTTTLYDIDAATDKLYIQNPPNDGTLVAVGNLDVNVEGEAGFDISPDGVALAVILKTGDDDDDDKKDKYANKKSGPQPRLYTIDLQSGKAKNEGKFERDIIGLAIPTNPVAYAVSETNELLIFNPLNSSSVISKPITGLQAGETIYGLDFRPVNGQLFALGSTSRLYTINASNGAALAVGAPFAPVLTGTSYGFDFNPTVDRIRVVGNSGQNLRLFPLTGQVAVVDGNTNPGMPMISAAAYTNNFAGSTTTVLYDIDAATDQLFIQNPPNSGGLLLVGNLDVDVDAANGFDITSVGNIAYAILTANNLSNLYTIDLSNGKATVMTAFPKRTTGFTVGLGF